MESKTKISPIKKKSPPPKTPKLNRNPRRALRGAVGGGLVWVFFWGGVGGYYWQKGEAVGSKPLKTSLSEAASCCSPSRAGLFPAKGLPAPDLAFCFTTP